MKEATVGWAVQRHPPYALSATRHSSCCLHHNRGTRGLHQSRNVFNQSNNTPTPPREPPPFWPTRVRVQHDSYIRSNRATVWQLMRDVTPADQWENVSVVLATLESIYGVEYQGLAAQLLTAFQEANLAPRPLDTTTAAVQQSVNGTTTTTNSSSSSNGRNREDTKQQQQQQQQQQEQEQQQYEHLGASVLGLNLDLLTGFRRSRRNSSSRGSSPEITTDDQDDDHTDQTRSEQQQQQQQRIDTASRMDATITPAKDAKVDDDGDDQEEQQAAAAAVADALFMQLLLLLAQRAGFVPLTERDIQLSISLNTDYLWQLFVKANTKQLDAQFIQQHVEGSSSSSSSNGSSPSSSSSSAAAAALELPRKAKSMLILRRGYSSEKQRRRWLIQKLDYLQLLLVKRLLLGVTGLAAAAWNQVAAAAAAVGGGTRKGRLRSEQVASDRRDPGSEKSHVHALNVEVEQQAGSRIDLTAEQQQQQLWLHSKQSQQHVKLHQHGKQQQRSGQPIRSSSSSSGRQKQRRQQQRPKTDAFGRVYDYVETEDEQNNEDVDTQVVVAAAAVSGSSSSKAQQQEQQQPRTQRWQQQLEAGGRRLQQQTKQHQRSLASRVVKGFNERLMVVAHTLSDWGLIPRMDVIPLERFDEVFPLDEPPRLKPLYIEKATLPDIMDPVIEPRLKWLTPHGNNSMSTPSSTTALTAADGYSSSSIDSLDTWELSPGSSGMKQADNSSRSSDHKIGFFDALLQPVEIVEPTFRQLLVVYRKKARRDRWKELTERLTGQKQTQTAARRSPIQLQVYRDIPLPSWQVVFPDKLLQFRPLDLLRLDLFGLAGVGAALAQAKYSSIVLQLFALASLSVWGLRITLGFLRMGDRYKTIIAQLLAERTVAGGEGGLEYLATAAGLQQFKQAALVYVILVGSNRAMTSEEIAMKVEALLEQRLKLQVCFNTEEALQELQRFGLLVTEQQQLAGQQQQPTTRQSRMVAPVRVSDSTRSGTSKSSSRSRDVLQQRAFVGRDGQQQQHRQLLTFRVLSSDEAQSVLQQYWAGLLRQRVNSILDDV